MPRLVLASLVLLLGSCNQPAAGGGSSTAATTTTAAVSAPAPAASAAGSSAAPAMAGDPSPDTVVASWDGGQITYGQLSGDIKNQLLKLQVDYLTQKYQAESDGLDQKLSEQLLDAEAKKRGLADSNALLDQEVKSKVADPTDAEIADFYPQIQRRLGNAPLDQVKDKVKSVLVQKKQHDRFDAFITELKTAHNAKLSLVMPELPRFDVSVDDDPVRGNPNAKVTIIQFADFQCPYCGRAYGTMNQVLKDYDGKVKMVFRDFPLGFHPHAKPAAIAANCAGKQGKYWEMFDQLMPNQSSMEEDDLTKYATNIGLNLDDWNACRKDPAMETEIDKDQADGMALGINGTPAFFIDGIELSGAVPYDQFKSIIDRELGS